MNEIYVNASIWGLIVWLASLLFSWWIWRVMWVTWVIKGMLPKAEKHISWRYFFIWWLILWGWLYKFLFPSYQIVNSNNNLIVAIIAWIIVWIWTSMANWCASWHAVCWIGRLSIRSIVATLVFVSSWMLTVFIFKYI